MPFNLSCVKKTICACSALFCLTSPAVGKESLPNVELTGGLLFQIIASELDVLDERAVSEPAEIDRELHVLIKASVDGEDRHLLLILAEDGDALEIGHIPMLRAAVER